MCITAAADGQPDTAAAAAVAAGAAFRGVAVASLQFGGFSGLRNHCADCRCRSVVHHSGRRTEGVHHVAITGAEAFSHHGNLTMAHTALSAALVRKRNFYNTHLRELSNQSKVLGAEHHHSIKITCADCR